VIDKFGTITTTPLVKKRIIYHRDLGVDTERHRYVPL